MSATTIDNAPAQADTVGASVSQVEGGDKLTVQVNMTFLDLLGKAPPAPANDATDAGGVSAHTQPEQEAATP